MMLMILMDLQYLLPTGIPVVVVNTRNKSIERIRFTIIHEIAHLLLKLEKDILENSKEVEKFAISFQLFSYSN